MFGFMNKIIKTNVWLTGKSNDFAHNVNMANCLRFDSNKADTRDNCRFYCWANSTAASSMQRVLPGPPHLTLIALTVGTGDNFPYEKLWPSRPNALCQTKTCTALFLYMAKIEKTNSIRFGRNANVCQMINRRHQTHWHISNMWIYLAINM